MEPVSLRAPSFDYFQHEYYRLGQMYAELAQWEEDLRQRESKIANRRQNGSQRGHGGQRGRQRGRGGRGEVRHYAPHTRRATAQPTPPPSETN